MWAAALAGEAYGLGAAEQAELAAAGELYAQQEREQLRTFLAQQRFAMAPYRSALEPIAPAALVGAVEGAWVETAQTA